MRWFPNISHSSSSSSSSSTRIPSSYYESPVRDRYRRGQRIFGPRLTRQRKLRHLTPLDVPPYQEPCPSALPSELSRSEGACAEAVPLPLPLPLRESDVDKDRTEGAGEGVPGSPSLRGGFASGRDKSKTSENLEGESHSAADQDHGNVNRIRHDHYWVDILCRSAPSSACASPQLSPRTQGTGETFSHLNAATQGNQIWSAPEMPFDLSGLLPPAFYNMSPIQSPHRSSGRPSPSLPVVSADPSYAPPPRLSVDVSNPRLANVNVHPLPLPPGASLPSPSSPAPHVPPNQEFVPMNSHWQKGKLIGRGTFGSVYVASNRETGALCAMKEVEIFPDDPKSAECIKQLEQEIKLLSQLQHQNIVQYFGSEILDDRFYIYLEYVHPGSINKYIREHCGAMTEPVVRNFTRHILSGLAYLHSKKTVHRDIKGANLLVDASGVVKLADFGTAKHLTEQRADLSLKGSPYWMAPELMQAVAQKDNSSDLAFAVDIWSLGCTIIEMMNGKPPWSEYEGAAAMFKVMSDTPPVPDSLSHDGKDFLKCCFRRNPAKRPTAAKLLEHRFFKNSQQHSSLQPDVSSCSKLFNGMKLTDRRERSSSGFKLDQFRILPGSRSTKRASTSESFMHPSFSPSRLTGQQQHQQQQPSLSHVSS